MRSQESTFINNLLGGSSSKGLNNMAQRIQQGKIMGGNTSVVDLEAAQRLHVQSSRNQSKKSIFSDRFDIQVEITRNNETLSGQIQNIEQNLVTDEVRPVPQTQHSHNSKTYVDFINGTPQLESRNDQTTRRLKSKHQDSVAHSMVNISTNQTQYGSPRWKMTQRIGQKKKSPRNIRQMDEKETIFSQRELQSRDMMQSPSCISQNIQESRASLAPSRNNLGLGQSYVANTLSPSGAVQPSHYTKKAPVDKLIQRFERKRITSPGDYSSYQRQLNNDVPSGVISRTSMHEEEFNDHVATHVQLITDSSLTRKLKKPTANFMQVVGGKNKINHGKRWSHIGRSNNCLSPRGQPMPDPGMQYNQRSVSHVKQKKNDRGNRKASKSPPEQNLVNMPDVGESAREFCLPQIPIKAVLGEKRTSTIQSETDGDGSSFITGLKRHSMERGVALDERTRVPLERTGENFANLQALPGTHAALNQTAEFEARDASIAGPGSAEDVPLTAALKSTSGGTGPRAKKSASIAPGPSPRKRAPRHSQPEIEGAQVMTNKLSCKLGVLAGEGLADSKFYGKNRELLGGLDLNSTKQGSKTASMFSAITKAGLPKKFNLPVLLNESSVVEQFYAARPDTIRLSLEQQKQIQATFVDVRSQQDIVQDPLLLSLANMRNSVDKSKKNKSNAEADNLQNMLNLLLGNSTPAPLIRNLSRKLNRKMYQKLFKAFTDEDEEGVFQKFAREIRDKRTYLELCKNAVKPATADNNGDNQMFRYFQECQGKKVLCLPILFKIINLKLTLNEYHVAPEMSDSLSEVIKSFPYVLEQVNLHRNGLRDVQMGKLIEAFGELSRFTSLVIKHNEFYSNSMLSLQPILQRPIGSSLEELKIVSCKTSPAIIERMLDILCENCNLQKLGLVQCQLGNIHIEKLRKFIADSQLLKELDLSWNELGMQQMLDITKVLASNRTLTFVNLSWNYLTSSDKQTPIKPQDEELNNHLKQLTKMSELDELDIANMTKENFQEKLAIYCRAIELIENRNPMKKHNEQIITNLSTFIKRNKKLLHLNLDSTQLSEYMLFNLCKCLTRAQSLLSLHASGNPGISVELKEMLWRRIRAKDPHEPIINIQMEKETNKDWKKTIGGQKREQMLKESLEVRAMAKRALDKGGLTELAATHHDTKLIFTRYLGHRMDIPGSGQWRMINEHEKCWICENYIYCLFFWNVRTGREAEDDQNGMEEEELAQKVEDANADNDLMDEFKEPHMMSSVSNWRPVQMMKLKDYCFHIDKWKPNFIGDLQKKTKIRNEVHCENDLTKQEKNLLATATRHYFEKKYNNYVSVSYTLQSSARYRNLFKPNVCLILEHEARIVQQEKKNNKALKKLEKRKRYVSSDSDQDSEEKRRKQEEEFESELDNEEYHEIYVYPCFLKPGKQTFLVGNEDRQYYLHQFIAPQRIDHIPPFHKQVKSLVRRRVFEFHSSVFSEWKEDTPDIIDECTESDIKMMKLDRIIKNDEKDKQKVIETIKKYGEDIKNIFMQVASGSNFPQITKQSWMELCQYKFKVVDKNLLKLAWIDTQFISATNSTNNEHKFESGNKIPGQMSRFEFTEGLLRIAKVRFMNSGETNKHAEALEMLMENFVFKNYNDEEWDEFRTTKMWTLEVNDYLKANQENIMQLLKIYHEPRKKTFILQDAMRMFLQDIEVKPVFKNDELVYAWGMSQMTVTNEKKHFVQYQTMVLVEFYEFLGRIADARFQNELPMETKLDELLKILFGQLLYKQPNPVDSESEEESESDDDY